MLIYGNDFGRLTQFVHKLRQFEDNWKTNGCCLPILQRNQVNEKGNVPRRGVVPTFSDLEVVALSITAEALSIDSENYLFNRLNTECPGTIPNLITRRQYNQRRKKTMLLGENIRQAIAKAIDGGETVFSIDSKPVKVCQNARAKRCQMGKDDIEHAPAWGYCASQNMYYYGYKLHALCGITGVIHSFDRKRIETVFSQLNDHLMMIRNYAKKPSGLFARMEAKVAAFTLLQYINLLNHRPIGQVKYALF